MSEQHLEQKGPLEGPASSEAIIANVDGRQSLRGGSSWKEVLLRDSYRVIPKEAADTTSRRQADSSMPETMLPLLLKLCLFFVSVFSVFRTR